MSQFHSFFHSEKLGYFFVHAASVPWAEETKITKTWLRSFDPLSYSVCRACVAAKCLTYVVCFRAENLLHTAHEVSSLADDVRHVRLLEYEHRHHKNNQEEFVNFYLKNQNPLWRLFLQCKLELYFLELGLDAKNISTIVKIFLDDYLF